MTIVPRWEWRTFGDGFDEAERRLAVAPRERTADEEDVYLLSRDSDASVKVRDGRMDVKQLLQVDSNRLEQWMPVMKAPLPLAAGEVRSVVSTLAVAAPPLEQPSYALDELVAALGRAAPAVTAVAVHKHREHFELGGCMAEVSVLRAGGRETRTIAVESEDPDRVWAAVGELGLRERPVTCVARGLKELTGAATAVRFAAIDVGTNSVKLHVGERDGDGRWRDVADRAEITRLGEGMGRDGRLADAPIERTADAVAAMAEEARRDGALDIAAVGTAALRMAPNATDLVDAVRSRCGVRIEVIPAEEEARLAYVAAVAALPADVDRLVVFDTGGGSSQFTFGRGARVEERFSLNVGAARFTERYGLERAVSEEVLAAALAAIASELATLRDRPRCDLVVGMGGAVTNLAAMRHGLARYDPRVVQGTELDRDEIDRQIDRLRRRDAAGRRTIAGLQPARAEVILAGACIVRTILGLLGGASLTVSDRGLRHGLLAERFGLG